MRLHKINFFVFLLILLNAQYLVAQPRERLVKIAVAPNQPDWEYQIGEKAVFQVTVMKNSEPIPQVKIKYEVGPELMPPVLKDSAILKNGQIDIHGGTMDEAGFLRCKVVAEVDGVLYEGLATAAYAPDQIKPTTGLPVDFMEFWEKAKAEAAKIPLDTKLTLLPGRCTE
ncbi:MAG: hypothetical protein WCY58_10610, partial [Mariniphaga sp.]